MTRSIPARLAALLLAIVVLGGCANGTQGVREVPARTATALLDTGVLQEAPYRIDIPAQWNGDLVMLLHGYEPAGMPRQQPWPQNEAAPVLLSMGYAVAASAYSSQGWSVAEAVPDNERLRAHFAARHGAPARTWLMGFSLGGHIALASIERHGRHYDGALSLCGVNLPAAQAFDQAVLPSLVAFDYFFPGAMGLATGGLADAASPPMLDPQALEAHLQGNEAAAAILSQRLDVPRSDLAGALMLNYLVLREASTRAGGFPVDNRSTRYTDFGDDAAFNSGVRRYAGDDDAMAYLAANADLGGRIDKPVVLQSNNDDPTVPGRFDSVYPQLVAAQERQRHLRVLAPVGSGHCAFAPEQIRHAFEQLLAVAQ